MNVPSGMLLLRIDIGGFVPEAPLAAPPPSLTPSSGGSSPCLFRVVVFITVRHLWQPHSRGREKARPRGPVMQPVRDSLAPSSARFWAEPSRR